MADTKKQSPLDVLEDILDNAEEQKEAKEKKLTELKEKAELQAKEDAADQLDLQQIAAQRAQMSNIGQTPEEQVRISQIKQAAEKKADQKSSREGFEIRQISHTKI